MSTPKCNLQFAVLGLGRFGTSIVKTLAGLDVNVMAIDREAAPLHEVADYATQVVQLDVSDEMALEKVGLGNFDVVVIAMSQDFEASIIGTMKAKELGVRRVIVKAMGLRQKKILESVGADQVVLPEVEMGEKLARNLVKPNVMDVMQETTQYTITEMHPLEAWVGKSVKEAGIREKDGYTILAVIRGESTIIPVPVDLVLQHSDVLITFEKN